QRLIDRPKRRLRAAAGSRDQPGGHPLLILQQRLQKVRRRDALMIHADRNGLRRLQKSLRAIGEFLEVHTIPCILTWEEIVIARSIATEHMWTDSTAVLDCFALLAMTALIMPKRVRCSVAFPQHKGAPRPFSSFRRRPESSRSPASSQSCVCIPSNSGMGIILPYFIPSLHAFILPLLFKIYP